MMVNYREHPLSNIASSPVVEVLDYSLLERREVATGKVTPLVMPATSNVLQYIAEDGSKLSIRPSGTEPKIKYYVGIRETAASPEDLPMAEQRANKRIAQLFEQLGI